MSAKLNFESLPDSALLREKQLIQGGGGYELLPFSPQTLWRLSREGRFPKPQKLSGNITAWRVGDVREWLSKQGA